MSLKCGIVGLPNVGKSTLFNALTSNKAEAANYPFCTIEPNTGVVKVPDARLDKLSEIVKPERTLPTTMEFVDIAGLVRGASKGEGLGNQFLSHIRETDAIGHVVRCFVDDDIVHVDGGVNPLRDISTIDTELVFADLDTVEKRHRNIERIARSGQKEAKIELGALIKVKEVLETGKAARTADLDDEQKLVIKNLHLITMKPVLYIANLDEESILDPDKNENFNLVKNHAVSENAEFVAICGKIESELAELSMDEKKEFLKDLGLNEPGLNLVIQKAYSLLGLSTYFTAGEKEVRAWTFKKGWKAPQAAGVIHTDFERGFIKAEAYHCEDLFREKSQSGLREKGLLRIEGKEYIVKDGDVLHFRFNV